MKPVSEIARQLDISFQRLNYWLKMPGCPQPEIRKQKKVLIRFYDAEELIKFYYACQATKYGMRERLVTIHQAATRLRTYAEKLSIALHSDDAPKPKSESQLKRKLYDIEELKSWWKSIDAAR